MDNYIFKKAQGNGQGSCFICDSKGIFNRSWMTFLFLNINNNKLYCEKCMNEYLKNMEGS